MFEKALHSFLSLYGLLYQIIYPCTFPEQLPANTVNRQQYLGQWYFQAAVSHKVADIQKFKAMDNMLFIIEEKANDTLQLTGHLRVGDTCMNHTWTYHIHPEKEDLELEGKPKRRNLLWRGTWANCANCIIFQEVEPPLKETDTEDSLNRFMLYCKAS
uniref:Apolipoprotein M n=1 Tax=Echeneis naucrates TaxID=173247 RepID=A0A665UB55_ECHNA